MGNSLFEEPAACSRRGRQQVLLQHLSYKPDYTVSHSEDVLFVVNFLASFYTMNNTVNS